MKTEDNKEFWQRKGLNGLFLNTILKSHKRSNLAGALRRCAIWRHE